MSEVPHFQQNIIIFRNLANIRKEIGVFGFAKLPEISRQEKVGNFISQLRQLRKNKV